MMKRNRHIALLAVARLLSAALCAAVGFHAHAASVTPAAATNYYFSTPLRPAHLRGEVMGDPPAYYIPRSEDYDWLAEAVAERRALRAVADGYPYYYGTNAVIRPEFGRWELSATNNFQRWVTAVDAAGVTNVVITYHYVTNSPTSANNPGPWFAETPWTTISPEWGSGNADVAHNFFNPPAVLGPDYRLGFLDPDVNLITNARAFAAGSLPSFTNVYTVASYTNTVTNSVSAIRIPMTNGTVSVHENRWSAYRSYLAMTAVTNVFELTNLDYCHLGDGAFPGFTNAPPLAGVQHFPVALSNSYVSLRGTTRLADPVLYPTNCDPASVYMYYYMGELGYVSTNGVSPGVGYSGRYYIGGEHYRAFLGYDEETGDPIFEWRHASSAEYSVPVQHGLTLPTRFISEVVTTGGVQRVTVEAAFALVSFRYSLDYGNAETEVYEQITDISKRVVVPIAAPEFLDTADAAIACLTLTVDGRSLLAAAAAASDAPSPPQSAAAFTPAEGNEEHWYADWSSFILFYRIHPTSKFVNW